MKKTNRELARHGECIDLPCLAVCCYLPVPQAEGFSFGLSDAPQAEPQAEGFFLGLSEDPQDEPQAEGFFSGFSEEPQEAATMQLTLEVFAKTARFLRGIIFPRSLMLTKKSL